ncbi:unnamed protein product [Musa acuminata var. zebrina]
MASVLKLLSTVLLLHSFVAGIPLYLSVCLYIYLPMIHVLGTDAVESQRCELSSIQVQQTNTGKKVGYDPVFEVEVKNLCRCTVRSVFLRSEGFASSMMVDPKLYRREGAGYIVNDGKGIPSSVSVKFCYAWDRAFTMSPASFQVGCW